MYARSRQQVIQLVQEVVISKGLPVHITHGWWDSFKRRNPKLTLRTAAPVSYARLVASEPKIINNYYNLLELTLSENDLLDKPAQIFNIDETGMPPLRQWLQDEGRNTPQLLDLETRHR